MQTRYLTAGLLFAVVVIGTLLTGTAAGQTGVQNASQADGEVVTDGLTLVNTSYESDGSGNGTLSLTFRAEREREGPVP